MIGLALAFLGLGLGDLVAAGLGGDRPRRPRAGLGVALLAIGGGAALCGMELWPALVLLALSAAGIGAWIVARRVRGNALGEAWATLGVLGLYLTLVLLGTPLWRASGGPFARWLDAADLSVVGARGFASVVALLGTALFLLATANGIVRLVLAAAGPDLIPSANRLRGGRLIGAIERLLIAGFVVAGEPTAVGLIVASKSLLRFPELSAAHQRRGVSPGPGSDMGPGRPIADVDAVTEYFLLGSMASWLVALVPAAFATG